MKNPMRGSTWVGGDGGSVLRVGEYGLVSRELARVSARQLEASRRVLRFTLKRRGTVWVNTFPDVPVTAKPLEVRMGKGKGSVEYWAAKVRPGTVLCEVSGVDREMALKALRAYGKKRPMGTRVVERASVIPRVR
jgi:large subunit ribosomal protein L16